MLGLIALGLFLSGCRPGNLGSATTGWSPTVASEGTVYIGTKQGEVKALFDTDSGSPGVLWTFRPSETGNGIEGVYSLPVVGERFVYVSAVDGYLYALEKEASGTTPKLEWRRPRGDTQGPSPLVGGPALDPDRNLVVVGSEDGNLYAYDAITGAPADWSPFKTGGKIWSTPAISDGIAYFGSHDKSVYAVNLRDGQLKWRFETGGAVVATPLIVGGLVVVGSFDRKLYAIDISDGTEAWRFEGSGNWYWAGAVANSRTIFAPSMDGNIYALDRGGMLLWKHDMKAPIVSTPALTPQGLVVANKRGKVSLLATSMEEMGIERESSLLNRDTQIWAPLFASEDGTSVYFGAQDSTVRRVSLLGREPLWCFNTEQGGRCE